MALRAFLRDVTAAILMFQNNETVARMLVFQTNPNGVFFLCKPFHLFQSICMDAGHLSENAQLEPQRVPGVQLFTLGA